MSLQSIIWVFLLNNFSRVINLLLTKLARDRPGRISALGLFCTYCQDLGPIFSQYGPRAWLIRYMYFCRRVMSNATLLYRDRSISYLCTVFNVSWPYRSAVCVLFLLRLKWLKSKYFYETNHGEYGFQVLRQV